MRKDSRKTMAAALLALLLAACLCACSEEEPVLDGVGQEVTFFPLEMDCYVCSYSDESIPLSLTVLALDGDYAKKGSVFRGAELIAYNGVRYPLTIQGVSEIKNGKKYYGYDAYTIDATLSLPAVGQHSFFAMELRYGEEEEQLEIVPLGDWVFEVISRPSIADPLYSEGFSQVGRQREGGSYPYHYNMIDTSVKLLRLRTSLNFCLEDPEGLPLTGSAPLTQTAPLALICPKLEVEGSQGQAVIHGSPVYCGYVPPEKENTEALTALAESALAYRLAYEG